ncbi:hypothetical protein BT96DRAFT_936695 [Gymnopus androsaceus JB14]|uniref:Uncharacterized protein n=1 Tax=Gymnopus androsaceus JB14 TaxID=1447944 RepID=A0A6A4HXC2_9AGAR|nr:hypothetical protein BT96DRAFT_936695 [Gymnopus androsaceus JB14]
MAIKSLSILYSLSPSPLLAFLVAFPNSNCSHIQDTNNPYMTNNNLLIPTQQTNPKPDPNATVNFATMQKGFFNLKAMFDGSLKDLANSLTDQIASPQTPMHHHLEGNTGFLQEIKDTLYLLWNTYTTDKDKGIYLATYLSDGTPKEWYKSMLISNVDKLYKVLEIILEMQCNTLVTICK